MGEVLLMCFLTSLSSRDVSSSYFILNSQKSPSHLPLLQSHLDLVEAEEENAALGCMQGGVLSGHQAVLGEQLDHGEAGEQEGETLTRTETGTT